MARSSARVLERKESIAWIGMRGHFDGGPGRNRALRLTVRATSKKNGGGA